MMMLNALLLSLFAVLGPTDVDMTLTPLDQNVTVNCVADVDLVLSAGAAATVSAVDVIITWDPAQFALQQAVPNSGGSWLATGFLNDPDGINDDLTDGDALFTALASPLSPLNVPPSATVVTFKFLVLAPGQIQIAPTLGVFGASKVVGTAPGEIITGAISGPISITTAVGSWTDIGGGTVGFAGQPTLTGSGTLAGGCPAGVSLIQARPNALMLAWVSVNPTPFPAVGGTVQAYPFISQFLFVANGAGNFSIGTTWPKGIPDGTNVWIQFLCVDGSVGPGITLSNGLLGTTPVP